MKTPSIINPRNFTFPLLITILLVGMVVRFWDLALHWSHMDDFGVAKSILDARQAGKFGWFAVSKFWTYSPFQFLITPLLISLEQSYREILFWGRLPSCIFACIGLLLWIVFYRAFDKEAKGALIFSLTLLVCSLENIIYAKQMSNYALGVSAAVGMLILLVFNLKHPNTSLKRILFNNVLLAIFSHMQYLMFFLLPAFWGTLFIFGLYGESAKWKLFFKNVIGGIFYGLLILPMTIAFIIPLQKSGNTGIYGWNKGPNNEFIFTLPDGSILQKIWYAITFYTQNFVLAFESNLAFVPEGNSWLPVITWTGIILFILGVIRLCRSNDVVRKYLALFTLLIALSWIVLICAQRLTLSPTRHHLLLLPLAALIMAEGVTFLIESWIYFFRRPPLTPDNKLSLTVHSTFALIVLVSFLLNYNVFLKERRDPFDEHLIIETLKRYDVDALITAEWVQHPELMKSVRDYFDYNGKNYIMGQKFFGIMTKGQVNYKTIAVISSEKPMDQATFDATRYQINEYIYSSNFLRERRDLDSLEFLRYPHSVYRISFQQEVEAGVENEFSSRTKHGRNGFYFYVFQR